MHGTDWPPAQPHTGGVVLDVIPLQTDHRYRGIGRYTAGLLAGFAGQDDLPELRLLMESGADEEYGGFAGLLAGRPGGTVAVHHPHWHRSRLRWLFSVLGIKAALRGAHARLYHATDPYACVHLHGMTTVATVYDFIPWVFPPALVGMRRLDERTGIAMSHQRLRRADRLIAISEATRQEAMLRLNIAPERIQVTPLAVDRALFAPPSPATIEAVITRYALRRPYFLYVGSADRHKNTRRLLRAFAQGAQQRGFEHALYIAGKWPDQATAHLHTAFPWLLETGRVGMLGFVPDQDLPALYGGATAFVYPSLMEGFGLPVLEAMCCATPVLTSGVSSLPEVGGDAALYVDPLRVDEIADALQRLADHTALRADMIARGLRRAELFSWKRTAELTLQVYRDSL